MPNSLRTTQFLMDKNLGTFQRLSMITKQDPARGAALATYKFYEVLPSDLVPYLLTEPATFTFIDLRDVPTKESAAICQIPGAYRIPVQETGLYDSMPGLTALKQKLAQGPQWNLLKLSNYIVCYCAVGQNRSPIAMLNLAYLVSQETPGLAGIGGKIVLLKGGYENYKVLLNGPRVKSTI